MDTSQPSADFEFSKPESPLELTSYVVVDAGVGELKVPFLFATAPDVPEAEAGASISESSSRASGLVIKILGNGFGGSAKLTVKSTREITAVAGETIVLAVSVPILWERRADPSNEDITWSHAEVRDDGRQSTPVSTYRDDNLVHLGKPLLKDTYDARQGGTKPLSVKESQSFDGGADFSVGFKNEAAGIEVTLKAELETSTEVALSATLPSGHLYEASWWANPSGARLSI